MTEFELSVLDFIQNIRCGFLDTVMTTVSMLGNKGILFIVLGIVLLFFKKTREMGMTVLLSLAIMFLSCNIILKNLFMRARPFTHNGFELIIPKPSDYSFPSGHSAASFAAAVSVFMYNKKWGRFFIALAVMIAFSRLYLYVHFVSDVVAGIAIGILSALLARAMLKPKFDKMK